VIHVEQSMPQPARWHRRSSHRTLRAAVRVAASSRASCTRIVVDARTLEVLLRTGEVYATAGGEWIAPAHGVAVEVA
jgi:hypothetical protein